MRSVLSSPWWFVLLCTLALGWTLLQATPYPLDDHFLYQRFIETLAAGKLDLTIAGFHGSDIPATLWHLMFPAAHSQIFFQIFCAILLPAAAFLAGRALWKSTDAGILLCAVITLMPFLSFVGLRGWTGPAYALLLLLTVYGAATHRFWTGITFGLAMLTKPFAIAFLPLLILLRPKKGSALKKWHPVLIGLLLVLLYMVVQYLQAGRLIAGSHELLSEQNVWQGPLRILLNLGHALQILFSVHNYYFIDPALTGPGNMMHTTPILIFLGIFGALGLTSTSTRRLHLVLLFGALIGILMNALLDHMDHFYMQASVILLIFAALPVLLRFPLWMPLVLATLHFQWFYFYLNYREGFALGNWFFLTPLLLDMLALIWCVMHWRHVRRVCSILLP
jgi:Gpi18-like mannosyltransferase